MSAKDRLRKRLASPHFKALVKVNERALEAETALFDLRAAVEALAEHMERTARDAYDEEAVGIAKDCASDLRALLPGGDDASREGAE